MTLSFKPTIMERAHQLARSGDCESILQIKQRLKTEGYTQIDSHLDGSSIRRVLGELIKLARPDQV